jgi:leucyl aminopeptidase (aminopeptidase T)
VTAPSETRFARTVLVDYLRLARGETVTVEAWSSALAGARAFVLEARRRGAAPVLVVEDEEAFFAALTDGSPVPAPAPPTARPRGCHVYLEGPEGFPRLLGLTPAEVRAVWRRHAGTWSATARAARLRGARIRLTGLSAAAAARYRVDLGAWRREVLDAGCVAPRRLASAAAAIVRRLARARRLAVVHPNGTRLELELRPGRWVEESGRAVAPPHRADPVWQEVPTGRVTFPVVPRSVNGRWEANRPTYDRFADAPIDSGARFTFRSGALHEFLFDRGGDRFVRATARRLRRSRPVQAVAFGVNPRIARAPEVSDLARGAFSLRLGAPLDGTGAAPYVSVLHGAGFEVDGRPWTFPDRRADR